MLNSNWLEGHYILVYIPFPLCPMTNACKQKIWIFVGHDLQTADHDHK